MSDEPIELFPEESKKEKDIDKLEAASRGLNASRPHQGITHDFGICNKCTHFVYMEFEGYGNFKAYCQQFYNKPLPRTVAERVVKCNCYWDKSHKTIRELYDLATWISTDGAKRIGFGGDDK